jgi:hypothetical protein
MRYLLHFVFFIVFSIAVKAHSSPVISSPRAAGAGINNPSLLQKGMIASLLSLNPGDIARLTGKKLPLGEKIILSLYGHKLKRQLQHPGKKEVKASAKTAFILGLTGLLCIFIPYFILASIPLAVLAIVIGSRARKADPNNRKAKTAIILGAITLAIILAIAVIAAFVINIGPLIHI